MSHDCALKHGDKVTNVKTHESAFVVSSDGLTVHVIFPGGQQALWAHGDVIWAEGAFADGGRAS